MLVFDVVTLFPGMFGGMWDDGILARARRAGHVAVRLHDLRRWGIGRHRQVDDAPYGGGGGMILRPEPLFEAVDWLRQHDPLAIDRTILLSPQGRPLDHEAAKGLAGSSRLVLLCGRYEGVDHRVREAVADDEIRVGEAVLCGGELPAMFLIEAVARFVPGVLGDPGAADRDSFAGGRLEHPYYTRPVEYRGRRVPEELLSGDPAAIARWRDRRSATVTRRDGPDRNCEGAAAEEGPQERGERGR